ncbi:hypothetical protein RD792_016709 [Penstemon davidsonii]|uniref:LOB domain-containing protein n=1 Tax=Penstemon davidsonii TaxID=160366 RepID=A0ABR0CKP4_9LAMI|nr:hypothetical protein RD792_016709 [Penstemon davidsonii]
MSSSSSPCAACKCLRRKCMQECVFAPYFPPDNPQKFTNVHKVFGASNVAKLLNELSPAQREDAVNSLAYEAEFRLRDPVYGCVGLISMLQQKLKDVQIDLDNAKKELATYIGPAAMLPILNHPGLMQHHPNYGPSAYHQAMPYNMQAMLGLPTGVPQGAQLFIREPQQHLQQHHQQQQQQHILEAQQLLAVAAGEQEEMLRNYGGFDDGGGPVTATGFNQIPGPTMQPSLALGGSSYETHPYHNIQQEESHSHSHPHQLQLQSHELLLQQQQSSIAQPEASHSLDPQRAKSEEGRGIDLC